MIAYEGKMDVNSKDYTVTDVFRAYTCIFDYWNLMDERTCVNGTVSLTDFGGYSMKLHSAVSLEERKDFIQTWQVTAEILY